MIDFFYTLSYGVMIIWIPLLMNLIFTLFVKKTKNDRFKFRFGKARGYENLNPIKSTGWALIAFILLELSIISLNIIFFDKLVSLLTLIKFNIIPLFLSALFFFIFWITKRDVGASWKNKFVWVPFVLFCLTLLVWFVILLIGGNI